MLKKAIQLYTFAVCMISVFIILMSFNNGVRTLPQYTITETRYSDYLERYEDDEAYIEYQQSIDPSFIMPEEEISNQRITERDNFINDKKAKAWEIISAELKRIAIAFAILMIHWYINNRVSLHNSPYSKK